MSGEKYGGTAYYSFYAKDKINTDVIQMGMINGECIIGVINQVMARQ